MRYVTPKGSIKFAAGTVGVARVVDAEGGEVAAASSGDTLYVHVPVSGQVGTPTARWQSDGADVAGADGFSFIVRETDAGKLIAARGKDASGRAYVTDPVPVDRIEITVSAGPQLSALNAGDTLSSAFLAGSYSHPLGVELETIYFVDGEEAAASTVAYGGRSVSVRQIVTAGDGGTEVLETATITVTKLPVIVSLSPTLDAMTSGDSIASAFTEGDYTHPTGIERVERHPYVDGVVKPLSHVPLPGQEVRVVETAVAEDGTAVSQATVERTVAEAAITVDTAPSLDALAAGDTIADAINDGAYSHPSGPVEVTGRQVSPAHAKSQEGVTYTLTVDVRAADGTQASFEAAPVTVPESTDTLVFTQAAAISGTPKVGQTLTLSATATGEGAVSYSYEWTRAGSPISGADQASYTLTAADDLADVGGSVDASDDVGSISSTAAPVSVTYPQPVAAGGIEDQTDWTVGVAIESVDVENDFTGQNLSLALAPSSAALPAGLSLSGGTISGTPTEPVASATIIVRGSNSGGYDDTAFQISVAEAPAEYLGVTFGGVTFYLEAPEFSA